MPHLNEKRVSPRVTTVVPVQCRVTGHAGPTLPSQRGVHGRSQDFAAKTVNVSRDGVLINCEIDLPSQTQLELELRAPLDGRVIRIATEVAWSRRNAMNLFGRYAAGLKVRKITERDRAVLENLFKPIS